VTTLDELLDAGAFDEAAELLAVATRDHPGDADAWHLRGVVAYRRAELDDARAWIERAIELSPHVAAYRVNLGNVKRAAGDLAGAITAFEHALVLDPDDARVLCNLGSAHGDAGDFATAVDVYRRSIALDPAHGDAYQGLVWALVSSGRVDEVDAVHHAWMRATPHDPAARWLAGADASTEAVAGYFDRFAATYDAVIDAIDYRVPHELAALLPAPDGAWSVLDAGCGSGRSGAIVRPWARSLCGADVSARMLALASETGHYDELVQGDAAAIVAARDFDFVFAADVLPYIEDPLPLFAAVRTIAFSIELALHDDVERRASSRFAHGEAIVQAMLAAAGLSVVTSRRGVLRREANDPVEGLLVYATRG
jgi:predicted TPR repeat methyltransferase